MNAVTMIKADHDRVAFLYKRYLRMAGDAVEQRTLVEYICRELEIHATLEEEIFYPALQAKLGTSGTDLVSEAIAEHQDMKHVIHMLRNGALAGPGYDSIVRRLMQNVQHHVREEEGKMLSQAECYLNSDLDELGMHMQQRKQALQTALPTTTSPGRQQRAADGYAQQVSTQHQSPQEQENDEVSTPEASDVHVPVHTA